MERVITYFDGYNFLDGLISMPDATCVGSDLDFRPSNHKMFRKETHNKFSKPAEPIALWNQARADGPATRLLLLVPISRKMSMSCGRLFVAESF